MKWLKHDSDAATDAKLKRVRHKYSFEGYGLYWYCVERINAKISVENLTFALEEDPDLIALDWHTDESRIIDMLNYMVKIGLFTRDDNGRIVCFNLAKRIDKSMTSNAQMREIIEKIRLKLIDDEASGQPKQAEIDLPQTDKPMPESGEPMIGSEKPMQDKTRLDKTRLDKTRLEEKTFNVDLSFNAFWSEWPKKGDNRKPALTKFKSKCKSVKKFDEIMVGLKKHLPDLQARENQFIPAASTWLNQERWGDDPPPTSGGPGGGFSVSGYGDVKGDL